MTTISPHFTSVFQDHHSRKHKKKEGKKHKQKKEEKKKLKKKHKKKELTDEQIDRTYTGLDREIAEEFIDATMEPSLSIQRAAHNTSFDTNMEHRSSFDATTSEPPFHPFHRSSSFDTTLEPHHLSSHRTFDTSYDQDSF